MDAIELLKATDQTPVAFACGKCGTIHHIASRRYADECCDPDLRAQNEEASRAAFRKKQDDLEAQRIAGVAARMERRDMSTPAPETSNGKDA